MLANRLKKNDRHLRRWARRRQIEAYRVYHRDIPEWPVTVDRVLDWAYLRLPSQSRMDLDELCQEVALGLDLAPEKVWCRELELPPVELIVPEPPGKFLVRFTPQRDFGLFLDHREARRQVAEACQGKRLLNLFCYTGSFSVQAARTGATASLSVDLSSAHLRWAERNFELNSMGTEHQLQRAEVREWLTQNPERQWDVVVLDPPTFSRSKSSPDDFQVQRDHPGLLDLAAAVLAPSGRLFFSTNFKKFRLDPEVESRYTVTEATQQTLSEDFKKTRIHRSYWIERRRHRS